MRSAGVGSPEADIPSDGELITEQAHGPQNLTY